MHLNVNKYLFRSFDLMYLNAVTNIILNELVTFYDHKKTHNIIEPSTSGIKWQVYSPSNHHPCNAW